jgi:hypothetical protein
MPGPSTRKLQPAAPDPEETKRQEELSSLPDENRVDTDHVESDEEQQARESEKAFDQAATRIPPG